MGGFGWSGVEWNRAPGGTGVTAVSIYTICCTVYRHRAAAADPSCSTPTAESPTTESVEWPDNDSVEWPDNHPTD